MAYDRRYFQGMGYVPWEPGRAVSAESAAELLERLGVKCVRLWHPFVPMMDGPGSLRPDHMRDRHQIIKALRRHGVEHIIAMNHGWFIPGEDGAPEFRGCAAPHRDAGGPDYGTFRDWYEEMWYIQAREFADVDGWETGNEMNHIPFLHASDGLERGEFTLEERADLCTELMYVSARAVRRGAPGTMVVMPGMAPIGGERVGVFAQSIRVEYEGMVKTLERIYENIARGAFGSKNPRDYFDKLCWHPYYARQDDMGEWSFMCPDEGWVAVNGAVYDVARRHGDGTVGVYLSEYGFNDGNDPEGDRTQAEYLVSGLRLAKERMPYVESVQVYRLLNVMDTPDIWDDYALFDCRTGKPRAKKKALAVQGFYGGRGAL